MSRASAALLAALALTALNAGKPLVIDDPLYVAYARQAALHPGDPYGFEVYWYDAPEPAMQIVAVPPVLPYWLALAMTLFGDHPVAWKLSLLPFALALTGSLAFLLRRCAPSFAAPVLFAVALGPSVLPGFNLMLDVPAVALGLLGYALFVLACERRAPPIALGAGLVLGLAMQTKYSAVVYPVLVLLHAAIHRRPREGAVSLCAAAALFVGWEAGMLALYQESHFLAGLERMRAIAQLPAIRLSPGEQPASAAAYRTVCLVSLLGGTLALPGLLAWVGLGATRLRVAGAAVLAGAGFAAVAALPRPPAFAAESFYGRLVADHPELLVFVPLGACVALALAAAAVRLLRHGGAADRPLDRTLVAWLALELAGYYVISPYPAARRVLSLGIAATLLAARATGLRGDSPDTRMGVRIAAAFAIALGMLYFGSDLADARARRELVERAGRRVAELGGDRASQTVWFLGHWEIQFHAERAGMRQLVADRSQLRPNDWVLLPETTPRAPLALPAGNFRQEDQLVAISASPWSTIAHYYDGPSPLRRQPEQQERIRILRVERDLVPRLRGGSSAR